LLKLNLKNIYFYLIDKKKYMDLKSKYPVEVLYDIVEKLYFEFRQHPDL